MSVLPPDNSVPKCFGYVLSKPTHKSVCNISIIITATRGLVIQVFVNQMDLRSLYNLC